MGVMLGQYNDQGKEKTIYCISKTLVDYEIRYLDVEKHCLTLVWATQKLRLYVLSHTIKLISKMDPLKYLLERHVLNKQLAKWRMLLREFDIEYVTHKSVKGQAIADHLAKHALPDCVPIKKDFLDEDLFVTKDLTWELYFDGARNEFGNCFTVILCSPEKIMFPTAIRLNFPCTSNIAEYESSIAGLENARELQSEQLRVVGNSFLIINQINREWKVRDKKLQLYQDLVAKSSKCFKRVTFQYVTRENNWFADTLATLAPMVNIPPQMSVQPFYIRHKSNLSPPKMDSEKEDQESEREEEMFTLGANQIVKTKPWNHDVSVLLKDRTYPEGASKRDRDTLRRFSINCLIEDDIIYKKSFEGILLRCIDQPEVNMVLNELHNERGHVEATLLAHKVRRQGSYWTTIAEDCWKYVNRCPKCQVYGDLIHAPSMPLNSTSLQELKEIKPLNILRGPPWPLSLDFLNNQPIWDEELNIKDKIILFPKEKRSKENDRGRGMIPLRGAPTFKEKKKIQQ
ncbi:uncharacterized protein LOC105421506 [Amborella trichopoda]|uniref:uncharacterized protein LOC105421506 n=1 Tax=Amborella trichopoda TaxID=13333 RepID=UPI0005D2F789|nr:uncharacterized protein LOC105421506 [Amborella trichopoda]|eukprot:XP_011627334.1 uncharacterized protein LOC105421506 [Amborella trichopoda]